MDSGWLGDLVSLMLIIVDCLFVHHDKLLCIDISDNADWLASYPLYVCLAECKTSHLLNECPQLHVKV